MVKRFKQRYGIDYDEVISPVAKYSTVRFILAMATHEKLELRQLDVKAAFLNGDLKEEILQISIYMEQPTGYCSSGHPDFIYRLYGAIYGLKQASRAWHMLCGAFLKSVGYLQSGADKSLYLLVFKGTQVFILVYVDDMLLVGITLAVLKEVAQIIGNRVAVRIENKVAKFLGIIIDRYREKGEIHIHSAAMIDHMLETFNMNACRGVSNHLAPGTVLTTVQSIRDSSVDKMEHKPYRQLVGSLLYMKNTTRPNIAFSTSLLSTFLENPSRLLWEAAKRVSRYLSQTKSNGNRSRLESRAGLHGYTNSDFAADKETRRSVSGFVLKMAGGTISWRSKKQESTAQSTLEADFVAISYAVREEVWLRRLIGEYIPSSSGLLATVVFGDNEGAMNLA